MALKFYDSPFHVNHDNEVASKMAMKMDLSIMLSRLIKEQGWTQQEAANKLNIKQSRVSDLINAKIEKFTIDAMFDLLDAFKRCSASFIAFRSTPFVVLVNECRTITVSKYFAI